SPSCSTTRPNGLWPTPAYEPRSEVFSYLEDRERTLDSPTDRIKLSLTTSADESEREKARQRTSFPGCAWVASGCRGLQPSATSRNEVVRFSSVFVCPIGLFICGLTVRFRPGSP